MPNLTFHGKVTADSADALQPGARTLLTEGIGFHCRRQCLHSYR